MPIVVVGGSAAPTRPPAPLLTELVAGDGSVFVRWSPQGDGRSTLTRFTIVTKRADTGAAVRIDQTSSASVSSFVVQPLTNGTAYSVTVAAVNLIGTSDASNTVTGTPATVVAPPPDPDPVVPPPPPPPVVVRDPTVQPLLWAFPVERTFRPEHWLLTPEEADAL